MKKHLLAVFLIAVAGAVTAHAQNFSSSANQNRRETVRKTPPQPATVRSVGAFPRATRGNPVQMINPRAPQKYYGPIEETVVWDPFGRDPYTRNQITGVILAGLRW